MKKKLSRAHSHTMELPRLIVVGNNNLNQIGKFLKTLSNPKKVSLISGKNVKSILGKKIEKSLTSSKIKFRWELTSTNDPNSIKNIQKKLEKSNDDLLLGIGGGRSVDIAKISAYKLKKPFVSVPTSASHDGMSSPFVSVRGEKPHSIVATAPLGVFVDVDVIKNAPRRLISSGCGDLIAKITAVKDWEIGSKKTGEYFGRYSANLALLSAKILTDNVSTFSKNNLNERAVVEALISSGVASCIAGSSRPCSGSEHLFSHAVDHIKPGIGLHGEKCGIGAIMMAKLQGQDWKKIIKTLKTVGAPTTANEIDLEPHILIEALTIAQSLRPERYTILKQHKMTESKALKLAKSTNVL